MLTVFICREMGCNKLVMVSCAKFRKPVCSETGLSPRMMSSCPKEAV